MSAAASGTDATAVRYAVDFGAGEPVFREGDLGTEMYIIQTGQVEIVRRVGDEDRQMAVLERGDFFGEMALLESLPRTATRAHPHPDPPAAHQRLDLRSDAAGQPGDRGADDAQAVAAAARDRPSAPRGAGHRRRGEQPTPDRPPTPRRRTPSSGWCIHESGMEFPLSAGDETMVGRRDPVTGIFPDIDLSPVDPQRAVSRRHAKLFRRDGKLYASEEIGTMNGTFVKETRLEKGVPVEVRPGDELRFGVVAVRFQSG